MARLMEATQFLISEYQEWVGSETKPEKTPAKTKGFEKLFELTKNPKSEVAALGGLDNIRRVRVLRDADDKELKDITLKFETKGAKPEVRQEPQRRPVSKKPLALFVPNIKLRLMSDLAKAIDLVKDHSPPLFDSLKVVSKSIDESDITELQSNAIIREMLLASFEMCRFLDEENLERRAALREAFILIDGTQALLTVACRMSTLFDRGEFMAFHKRLTQPKTPNRPPQKPASVPTA